LSNNTVGPNAKIISKN